MAVELSPTTDIERYVDNLDIEVGTSETVLGEKLTYFTWNTTLNAQEFLSSYMKILHSYIKDGANRESPNEYEDDAPEDYAYFKHGFSVVIGDLRWSSRLSQMQKPRQIQTLTEAVLIDQAVSHVMQIRTPGGNFIFAHQKGEGSWITIESSNNFADLAAWMIQMQENLTDEQEYQLSNLLRYQCNCL